MKKEIITMKKITNKVNELAVRGYIKGAQAKEKVVSVLTQRSGEGFVDTALVRHVSN